MAASAATLQEQQTQKRKLQLEQRPQDGIHHLPSIAEDETRKGIPISNETDQGPVMDLVSAAYHYLLSWMPYAADPIEESKEEEGTLATMARMTEQFDIMKLVDD